MLEDWQKIDGHCHFCHSWQERDERRITAMTELIIFWTIVFVVAVVLSTLRDIYDDGLSRRQPPPSDYPDMFDPSSSLRVR
jgi:hypothetical protein